MCLIQLNATPVIMQRYFKIKMSKYKCCSAHPFRINVKCLMFSHVGVQSSSKGSTCDTKYTGMFFEKQITLQRKCGAFDTWNVVSALRELTVLNILKSYPHKNCIAAFCVTHSYTPKTCLLTFTRQQMDLSHFIRHSKPDSNYANAVYKITVEVCHGICHLHTLHLVHCDIKTENILLSYDNKLNNLTIMLCDFGLCRMHNTVLPWDQDVVTFSYRPPEHMANSSVVYKTADSWSLGVLILAMLQQKPHPLGVGCHSTVMQNTCDFLGPNWPHQTEYQTLVRKKLQCKACDNEYPCANQRNCRVRMATHWQNLTEAHVPSKANKFIAWENIPHSFASDALPKSSLLVAMSEAFTICSKTRPTVEFILNNNLEYKLLKCAQKRRRTTKQTTTNDDFIYNLLLKLEDRNLWKDKGASAMELFDYHIEALQSL